MDILVAFHLDEKIHREFKTKVAQLGLKQKTVYEKLVKDYLNNGSHNTA